MQQTESIDYTLEKDIPSNWFPLFSLIIDGKYNGMPIPSILNVYGVDSNDVIEELPSVVQSDWDIDNHKITFHFTDESHRDSYLYSNLKLDVHDNNIAVLLVK